MLMLHVSAILGRTPLPRYRRLTGPSVRSKAVALIALAAASVGGCAQDITTALPDLKRPDADSLLTPAQQQKAIDDLTRKRADEQASAVKQIERSR
jgi:hypothetical protein